MENVADEKHVWRWLAAITFAALAVRLVAIVFLYRNTWNNYDNHLLFGFEIGRIARSLAMGHGYGNPMLIETGPTAWMTPVYPYLLAAVFKLFGIYSRNSAFVILGFNALFSALICIPVFFIAQHGFGRNVAFAACWMWALWPYSCYIASGFVWETCLSALLLAILFLWTLQLRNQVGRWNWLGYGALWGMAALTNASTLSVFPFFTGWALVPLWPNRRMWLNGTALAVFGLAIALLPWQLRNYHTFHKPIPLRDNFWLEVWVGNDGHNESWADVTAHPSVDRRELAEFVRLGEIPYMQEKRREALGFLAQHPGLFLELCVRRFVYMWTGFWNLDARSLQIELHSPANIYLPVSLTVAMLFGLWQASRSDRAALLPYLLLLAIYPIVFYLTHPELRYRHIIEPEIIVLAAIGARFLYVSSSQTLSDAFGAANTNK
jgi:hypothetical protein